MPSTTAGIGERRRVAERLSSATSRSSRRMILPERVFGSSSVNRIDFGFAIGPISSATWSRSSSTSASLGSLPRAQDDERGDRLTGGRRRSLPTTAASATAGWSTSADSTSVVRDVVARHEHDVVDAAEQPEVAVVVALGAVAREVLAVEAAPVRVAVALGIAPDAAQHRRPRPFEHEVAAAGDADRLARVVDDVGLDARAAGTSRSRASAWSRRAAG